MPPARLVRPLTYRRMEGTSVGVNLALSGRTLTLQVVDYGVGVGTPNRSSGGSTLAERARALGGRVVVSPGPSGGASLEWRVPVAPHAAGTDTGAEVAAAAPASSLRSPGPRRTAASGSGAGLEHLTCLSVLLRCAQHTHDR